MNEGIIYILTNPAMPDYIKIGFTNREDIKSRLKELYSTGVPFPFELHYAIKVNDAKNIESKLHKIFSIHRENINREFFKMDPERAVIALELVNGQEISLTDEEIYEQEDIQVVEKNRKQPISAFKFSMVGIPLGAELTFTRDENIKCIVISDNTIKYQGEEYSMSALAKILLDYKYGVQGTLYWMYEGKTLVELRKEIELEQDSE